MKAKQERRLVLGNLKWAPGGRKKKKRVARGTSSGHGKTATRGHKGQKSRSGGVMRPGFEGGQTPLYRRLPKINRFKNFLFRNRYRIINLSQLSKFKDTVNLDKLLEKGFVDTGDRVKILGDGKLTHALNIEAHAFSASAKKKIEDAGGKALLIK